MNQSQGITVSGTPEKALVKKYCRRFFALAPNPSLTLFALHSTPLSECMEQANQDLTLNYSRDFGNMGGGRRRLLKKSK